MREPTDGLLAEINKRLTLNLLIQGAAQHAFLTAHYLVRDELNEIDPKLLRLYDQIALAGYLQYWHGEHVLWFGRPDRFWKRIQRPGPHPFSRHPLLARHGRALAQSGRRRANERRREKRVTTLPVLFSAQLFMLVMRCWSREGPHRPELERLAKMATHQVWGIPLVQMQAALTRHVQFGELRPPDNFQSTMLRASVAGYGGVIDIGGELQVHARAWLWPLLSHELVKGTAELICLHGLNEMIEPVYREVVATADRIEYEPWMLQAGAELWRQLLPLLPPDRPTAEMLMHLSQLPPAALEPLMLAVVERPDWARELLAGLG